MGTPRGTRISCLPISSFRYPLPSIGSSSAHPLQVSLPGDPSSGAVPHIGKITRGGLRNVLGQDQSYRDATTISTLPDDVLLEIFDFYKEGYGLSPYNVCKWRVLVHVCQSWRQIVFASPQRLNLQISCTPINPVRKHLGLWPPFPIIIYYSYPWSITPNNEDNVIAALEHPNRVCHVTLNITGSQSGNIARSMQEPFPVLTHLHIVSELKDENEPALPAAFLGGSAPCLQTIHLQGIPFPTLPTLLLSTSDLVTLELHGIPQTGYILPEAMVAGLAALPRLETFIIGFKSAISHPHRITPPPVTRAVLPALTCFEFHGADEYLEDLIARIDSPELGEVLVVCYSHLVDFPAAQLSKFIDRSTGSESTSFEHVEAIFDDDEVFFATCRGPSYQPSDCPPTMTSISCRGFDWQVSDIAQILSQFSAILSNVVHLELRLEPEENRIDNAAWLHLFHQFTTVKALCVSGRFSGHVALALEEITGEMVAEVLPSLDLIYLADQPASSIAKFTTAHRLSGLPVTVVDTLKDFNEKIFESYACE